MTISFFYLAPVLAFDPLPQHSSKHFLHLAAAVVTARKWLLLGQSRSNLARATQFQANLCQA